MTNVFLHITHLFFVMFLFLRGIDKQDVQGFQLSGHAQGTTWHITYFHADSAVGKYDIDSILNVIDSSLSIYKPYSTIVAFNKSDVGVRADEHFRNVVQRSIEIYNETGGLSDITVGPLTDAWGFGASRSTSVPTDHEIKEFLQCVGSPNILLRNDSVIKLKPCLKLDVNGIAQGYSVDVIANFLESRSVDDYLVELGGEMRVKGKKQPGNRPFSIGIESPSADDFSSPPIQKIISVNAGAVTTSGNYRKYHESEGKKYSHILHPKTGKSVDNEMISATVYAPDATTADAYDNALMLMGVERALKYIDERPVLAAFLIYKDKDGKIADTASARFRELFFHLRETK